MRQAAANATVLLRNDRGLLPIKPNTKKIAIFGQNASIPTPTGGGSASLTTSYVISPLEAITKAAQETGTEVDYSIGAEVYAYLPVIDKYLVPTEQGGPLATLELWKPSNPPSDHWLDHTPGLAPESPADLKTPQTSANVIPYDGQYVPMGVAGQCSRVSPFCCK
jgi:beta-glucosidase